MNIEFDSTALEELYSSGTTLDKRYKRFPEDMFHSLPDESGIVVNALLTDISKHYE